MRSFSWTHGLCLLLLTAPAWPAASQSAGVPGRTLEGSLTQRAAPVRSEAAPSSLYAALEEGLPPPVDEVEPNNALNTAQVLGGRSPVVVDGAIQASDQGDFTINYNDFGEDDLEDLFLVTVTAPGWTVELSGFTGNLDLIVADENGQNILAFSSFGGETPERIEAAELGAGTYLIGVNFFEAGGATGQTDYRLRVAGVEFEPNDAQATALLLEGPSPIVILGAAEASDDGEIFNTYTTNDGGTIQDDMEDVFALTTTAPGLRITLSEFSEDLDVFILDPADLTILASSNGENNPETIDASTLPAGDYLIVLSFFDGTGETGETTYRLEVEGRFESGGNAAPTVAHEPAGDPTAGQAYSVTATLTDDGGIQSATLFYRQGGAAGFSEVAMTADGDGRYTAEVPAGDVTARGLAYFVQAEDAEGLTARTPTFGLAVDVGGDGLQAGVSVPTSEAGSYRLVSVPLRPGNASAAAVLADDLGDYDPEVWRLYSLQADQSYAEFPGAAAMTPGRAFWLGLKEAATFDTGAGTSVSLAEPFRIALNAGWNFVGNPFSFDVPLGNVRMGSGQALDVRAYNGSTWSQHTGALAPFAGYAVFAEAADELVVDPGLNAAKGPSLAAKRALLRRVEGGWDIRVRAEAGRAVDADNVAAVHPEAASGRDRRDRPEPPTVGDYVSASFVHPEPGGPAGAFSTDARGPIGERETWTLAVRSNTRGRVDLLFDVTSVPEGYDVHLEDDRLPIRQDLRARPRYAFVGAGDEAARRLRLVVERAGLSAPDVPERVTLSNHPNPFSEATTLHFGLPSPAPVSVTVHDALGRTVANLLDGQGYEAGTHSLVWDGRNQAGHAVASGVYLYRITAGTHTRTGTMVLVK